MFAYVSNWKMKGYQGVQLLIRTKDETVFALFFKNWVFSFVFSILPMMDILETNMLNFPVLNIAIILIFLSMHNVNS